MQIEFVGRNYHVGQNVRGFTEDRIEKISHFLEEPVEVRVTLGEEKRTHFAEVHISHRHGILQSTEETAEMFDAINLAIDKVEKQARRSRKKFQDTRRRADRHVTEHAHWPVEVLEGQAVETGSQPKIIKTSSLRIKPMTIEEAALELRDSKNDFRVFRDSATDTVNVLYRRKDGNYGLITPDL